MFNIKITTSDYNLDDTSEPSLTGGGCCAKEVLHPITVCQIVTITTKTGEHNFELTYQNANSTAHSSSCLSNELELVHDSGFTNEEITTIMLNYSSDEDIEYILEELQEYNSIIDTVDKVRQVYETIIDNEPFYEDFLDDGHSTNPDDYYNYDGELKLKIKLKLTSEEKIIDGVCVAEAIDVNTKLGYKLTWTADKDGKYYYGDEVITDDDDVEIDSDNVIILND